MNPLAHLFNADRRIVQREPMLALMAVLPIATVLAVRWLIPVIETRYGEKLHLSEYFPLIASFFFVLQMPLLFGCVSGLIFLEEREQGVIAAIRVTPLPFGRFVVFRTLLAALITFAAVLLTLTTSGLCDAPIAAGVQIAFVAGCSSLVYALALPAFSENRIEAIAIMKVFGIGLLGPIAAFFVHSGWQWLFGLLPTFWLAKATWMACRSESGYVGPLIIGLVYQAGVARIMFTRFKRRCD